MKSVLSVRRVQKHYKRGANKISALRPTDISVQPGEFVCIIGPNGSGKSTLLKVIAGILKPDAGTIDRFARISYLPQQPSLLPWRNVEANLRLPGDLRGTSDLANKTRAKKLLKEFKLAKFADFYPHELSGGMQQKVALLRTIMVNPGIILLDEPFSALDAITRRELQGWLTELWAKDRPAVVCVTHDVREAIFLADTIYVMSERPGTISKKIKVNLPRPRALDQLLSTEAEEMEKRLNNLLEPR